MYSKSKIAKLFLSRHFLNSHTNQRSAFWRLRTFVKFWIVQAQMNVWFRLKWNTKVRDKIHSTTITYFRHKTLLIQSHSESHSRRKSTRVFQYKTQYETHHHHFRSIAKEAMRQSCLQFTSRTINSEYKKKSDVIAKDQSAWNFIVNVFRRRYFAMRTVTVTTVGIILKTWQGINRQ